MIDIKPPQRIYNQYIDKPKIVLWLESSYLIGNSICLAANQVSLSYGIEFNVGKQLDIIADIVGTSRRYADTLQLGVQQFNDKGDSEFGNPDAEFSEPNVVSDPALSDNYLRRIIKAKIQQNISTSTCDDILTALRLISVDADFVRVVDNQDMTITVEYAGTIDPIAVNLINNANIIPLPQCVSVFDFIKVERNI